MDIETIVFFDGFAIRIAAVIDPARGIAAAIRIHDHAVIEQKQECVIAFVTAIQLVSLGFGYYPALVLDDAFAFRNRPPRKYTLTVNTRTPHDNRRRAAAALLCDHAAESCSNETVC